MSRAEPCRDLLGKETEEVNGAELLEVMQGFCWLPWGPPQEKDFQLKIFSKGILYLLRPCIESFGFVLKALETLWQVFQELLGFPFRHQFLKNKSIFYFNRGKKHIRKRRLQQSVQLLFLPVIFPSHFSRAGIWNFFQIPRDLLQSFISQTNFKELFPKSSCSSSTCKSPSSLVQTNFVGWPSAMQTHIPLFWHCLSLVRREK